MTRTDTFVVGALVVLLAIVAGLIGVPALQRASTAASATSTPRASAPLEAARPYVEGAVGAPTSVSPLTARTQVDRDLVGLVFSGLVRNGPGGTVVPDLAARWSVDASGKTWTVDLRADALWHDGAPVTAEDVVFTITALQDPDYTGPSASSWREVTVAATNPLQVTFTLATPLGGFLQALTQPIAPAHLLAGVPIDALPGDPFGRQPVGSGPFAVTELSDTAASLVPAGVLATDTDAPTSSPTAGATDSLTTPGPTARPSRPIPYLAGIEFRFYTDPASLAADFRSGAVDGASGLSPQLAAELGAIDGAHLLRYPGGTLAAALLNLRPSHPEFASPAVRTAFLAAIDRGRLISEAYAGAAQVATGPISPVSPLYDATAAPPVAYSRTDAGKALRAAGWTRDDKGWYLPKVKTPLSIEVLSPTDATNHALFAAAEAVVRDWTAIGLTVTHVALPPGEFVTDRLATGTFQVAVADVRIGLDADLYPLLASSQTLKGGSNVMGVQDQTLDRLLVKARAPGSDATRLAAYSALQKQLTKGRYLLPLAFPDAVVVLSDAVEGPVIRQVTDPSDRFWDVLTWRLAVDR
ncbi:MAG: ABC transporter substrate-binding protein [Candidatus Limnocylindrales bacterium]